MSSFGFGDLRAALDDAAKPPKAYIREIDADDIEAALNEMSDSSVRNNSSINLEDLMSRMGMEGEIELKNMRDAIVRITYNRSLLINSYLQEQELPVQEVFEDQEFYDAIKRLYETGQLFSHGSYGVIVRVVDPDTNKSYFIQRVEITSLNECTLKGGSYPRCDTFQKERIPPGSAYLCNGSAFTEFIISTLVSQLNNLSTTFLPVYGVIGERSDKHIYTLLGSASATFDSLIANNRDQKVLDSLLIQLLHGIYSMQLIKVNHNNLTHSNMMIGTRAKKGGFIRLELGDKSLYVPDVGLYPKMVDFSLAIKYKTPGIIPSNAAAGSNCTIPNWFSRMFDAVTVLGTFALVGHQLSRDILKRLDFTENMWSQRYNKPRYYEYGPVQEDGHVYPTLDSNGNPIPTGFHRIDRAWTIEQLFNTPELNDYFYLEEIGGSKSSRVITPEDLQ